MLFYNWKKITETLIEKLLEFLGLSELKNCLIFIEKKNISHKICREEGNNCFLSNSLRITVFEVIKQTQRRALIPKLKTEFGYAFKHWSTPPHAKKREVLTAVWIVSNWGEFCIFYCRAL
jgi:hypothetical protein